MKHSIALGSCLFALLAFPVLLASGCGESSSEGGGGTGGSGGSGGAAGAASGGCSQWSETRVMEVTQTGNTCPPPSFLPFQGPMSWTLSVQDDGTHLQIGNDPEWFDFVGTLDCQGASFNFSGSFSYADVVDAACNYTAVLEHDGSFVDGFPNGSFTLTVTGTGSCPLQCQVDGNAAGASVTR